MNLILFEADEVDKPLARTDPRAVHLLEVLRCKPGDSFDAGPRGKATIEAVGEGDLELSFTWLEEPPALEPISLIVGLPRPQAARRVLAEVTSLGAAAIYFPRSARGERSYADSTLWRSGEWRRHLIAGAQQAFTTRLPAVEVGGSLTDAIATSISAEGTRLVLDNYEAAHPLGQLDITLPTVLAVGPERGWSDAERWLFREHGFELVHLGQRVLRTETACIAALTLVRARLGLI